MGRDTILYFGGFMLPDKNAAAHRVVANAKILVELGYKVKLIGLRSEEKMEKMQQIPSNLKKIEFFSFPYPSNTKDWLKYLFSIKYIKTFIDDSVHAVIFYNFQSFSFLRIENFLRMKGIKCIADCTEWYGSPEGSIIKKIIKNVDTALRMRWINKKKMDGIITISKYLAQYYIKYNTLLLPPLIDKMDAKWENKITEIDFIRGNTIQFIYAGQLGNKDKIDKIIYAINEIKDKANREIVFNIIGLSKEEFIKSGLPVFSYMIFFGRIPHNVAIQKIKDADFTIFLRENNRTNNAGFPTKFVETIGCGTPVITNASSNILDYLKEGENGFVISNDNIEDIKNKIGKIVDLDKKIIFKLKNLCLHDTIFDYRNYIDKFSLFLIKIFK